jgi:hypothetical protein
MPTRLQIATEQNLTAFIFAVQRRVVCVQTHAYPRCRGTQPILTDIALCNYLNQVSVECNTAFWNCLVGEHHYRVLSSSIVERRC